MTENYRQKISGQLARVVTFNLACLSLFAAFCGIVALGSPSLLAAYWHDHHAGSVVVMMILVVSIPGFVELMLSRFGFWQS